MPDTTVGFDKPKSFPDFTQCDQTTPELNKDWKATIRDWGRRPRVFENYAVVRPGADLGADR